MPDNVDDIVADIAQEEKEEGREFCSHLSLLFIQYQIKSLDKSSRLLYIKTCSIILQMILLRPVSIPTGLHGPLAAQLLVKRASE